MLRIKEPEHPLPIYPTTTPSLRLAALLLGVSCAFIGLPASASSQAFDAEQRLDCQLRLEDVRWAQRIWPQQNESPKPARQEVLSDDEIRAEVEDSLRQETALQQRYGIHISSARLQAELERMAANTRAPDQLQALFEALDNDPNAIAECIARPELVQRELDEAYRDEQLKLGGQQPKPSAFDQWWQVEAEHWQPNPKRRLSSEISLPSISTMHQSSDLGSSKPQLEDAWLYRQPSARTGHSAVWTGTEMIVWGGEASSVVTNTGGRYNPATDSWQGISQIGAPTARQGHTAVWTGQEMIVWGGGVYQGDMDSGARYDPASDTWQALDTSWTPEPRWSHIAVWTGKEMIVWGGEKSSWNGLRSGGRYDPKLDRWYATDTQNAPDPTLASGVWSGTELLIWGNGGGRYNPTTDLWRDISQTNAPQNQSASAVWTGANMLVIGMGSDGINGLYDPQGDTWQPVAASGVHSYLSRIVWANGRLLQFGWESDEKFFGLSYDPRGDRWTELNVEGAPMPPDSFSLIWSGQQAILWGGQKNEGNLHYQGIKYDPVADQWQPMLATFAAVDSSYPNFRSQVWTGREMILWPAEEDNNSGYRYDPALDTWSSLSTRGEAPRPRSGHTAIWTGKEMIIWGGDNRSDSLLETGGRYNPLLDRWQATRGQPPSGRVEHTATWTGRYMLVWGGEDDFGQKLGTGGRYDPVTDQWLATQLRNAPSPRSDHTAVLAQGQVMIWGGNKNRTMEDQNSTLDTGSVYNPKTNAWRKLPKAPEARAEHTAVWSGEKLLVWGGKRDYKLVAGGLAYDPHTFRWSQLPTDDQAPEGLIGHSAVWTGSEMIIWGGNAGDSCLNSGSRYNPELEQWTALPLLNAPIARCDHGALWTGDRMLIWGGESNVSSYLDLGVYFPPVAADE